MPARPNITGFDPRKLAAAAGQAVNDPWARREAWRYTGPFTRWQRFNRTLPGLGWGAGAFAVYLVYDTLTGTKGHGHEEDGHSEAGHH